jgi:hypothetical protein
MTIEVLFGALLIFLSGLAAGIWFDRRWLLKRGRGTTPVPKKRKPFDFRVQMADLYGHEKWILFDALDQSQHKKFAHHIIRYYSRADGFTFEMLTPASKRVMSVDQLKKVRPILRAREMVTYNPRSGKITPLPLLAEWAAGYLRWATHTE